MATIYLLRHAHSVANGAGILAGRSVGNPLSPIGEQQARQIASKLADENFAAIYYSPLERCRQTIEPLLEIVGKRPRKFPEFLEMDYGSWTGQSLSLLRKERLWREIQKHPSEVTFPRGESFRAAHRRILRGMNLMNEKHGDRKVLIVSHGDIIKLALASAFGLDVDRFQRIVVDPASLSIIDWGAKVVVQSNTHLVKSKAQSKVKTSTSRRDVGGGTNV